MRGFNDVTAYTNCKHNVHLSFLYLRLLLCWQYFGSDLNHLMEHERQFGPAQSATQVVEDEKAGGFERPLRVQFVPNLFCSLGLSLSLFMFPPLSVFLAWSTKVFAWFPRRLSWSGQQYPLLGFKLYNFLNELFNLEHCMTGYDIYNKPISRQTTERAKEMSRCLKIPVVVLPGNLASPCTANQPISESLSSILWTWQE